MLRSIASLRRCTIAATDGDIGKVTDVYFEDEGWTVRYLVVDTGTWLSGKEVLLSPLSFRSGEHEPERLFVTLSRARVKDSPDIDTARPVSRQHEIEFSRYYGYPTYWEGPYRWGPTPFPGLPGAWPGPEAMPAPTAVEREIEARMAWEQENADPHLRSARAVSDYYIEAVDGEIGHVEELFVDDQDWAIRYMAIDTRNWWPGKKVLISPAWVDRLNYEESKVHIGLRRDAIQGAPEYVPDRLDREYETRLYSHYGKPPYWDQPPESWRLFPSARRRRRAA